MSAKIIFFILFCIIKLIFTANMIFFNFRKHDKNYSTSIYMNICYRYIDLYKSALMLGPRALIMGSCLNAQTVCVGLIKARNTNHRNNIMLSVDFGHWTLFSLRHIPNLFYCRTKLPVPMFDRNDFSVWTILKQCIGKVTWSHVMTTCLL